MNIEKIDNETKIIKIVLIMVTHFITRLSMERLGPKK